MKRSFISLLFLSLALVVAGPGAVLAQDGAAGPSAPGTAGAGAHSASGAPSLGLTVTPEALIPVGPRAANYRAGFGARLDGLLGLSMAPWVSPVASVGYSFVPLELSQDGYLGETSLGVVRANAGLKAGWSLGERLGIWSRLGAGGYLGFLQGADAGSAAGLSMAGEAGMSFLISAEWMIELSAGYQGFAGLYDGISVGLLATTRLSGAGGTTIPRADFVPAAPGGVPAEGYIRFASVELDRVFPVLYKYYDDHPIGSATIVNDGDRQIEEVEVRFALRQFMDVPKVSARLESLEPGAQATVDLYALFTDDVLRATEGAKVAGEITASYSVGNRSGADGEVVTLDTYERNALRWDDDRKIAAFVTARDDEVQRFARNVASIVDDHGVPAIERQLQLAMVLLAALDEHRCAYVVDPSSPYSQLSQDADVVDSVQFPRQTLQFRAGDCDDLSATYAALLEAVGVSTAFVTVPGHIYTAFKVDLSPGEAGRAFSRPGDLIRRGEEVWIPVETTLLAEGFSAAWAEGARQWREHSPSGAAGFLPTREAWQTYAPVAFDVSDYEVDIPVRDDVVYAFEGELDRFVSREIRDQEEELLERLDRRANDHRTRNRLGVLYARYGRLDQAHEQFRIAAAADYSPALVNLGNLAYLKGDTQEARRSYEAALSDDPENAAALLGIARLEYAAENYPEAEAAHERLAGIDPDTAERFSHLGSGATDTARASAANQLASIVVWEE